MRSTRSPAPVEEAEAPVTQQDLDQLKQLVQSFNTELQALDAKIADLDKKTTALKGERIIDVTLFFRSNISGFLFQIEDKL